MKPLHRARAGEPDRAASPFSAVATLTQSGCQSQRIRPNVLSPDSRPIEQRLFVSRCAVPIMRHALVRPSYRTLRPNAAIIFTDLTVSVAFSWFDEPIATRRASLSFNLASLVIPVTSTLWPRYAVRSPPDKALRAGMYDSNVLMTRYLLVNAAFKICARTYVRGCRGRC